MGSSSSDHLVPILPLHFSSAASALTLADPDSPNLLQEQGFVGKYDSLLFTSTDILHIKEVDLPGLLIEIKPI